MGMLGKLLFPSPPHRLMVGRQILSAPSGNDGSNPPGAYLLHFFVPRSRLFAQQAEPDSTGEMGFE